MILKKINIVNNYLFNLNQFKIKLFMHLLKYLENNTITLGLFYGILTVITYCIGLNWKKYSKYVYIKCKVT